MKDGTITQDQYDGLQREIVETEQKLKSLEEQAKASGTALQDIAAKGEKLKTVGDNENIQKPASYSVNLSDVEADSGGVTEAGTTQRDVVREGVVQIGVTFRVSKKWLIIRIYNATRNTSCV